MPENNYENLEIGQYVVFHDNRQQEIVGTVKAREEYEDHIRYLLELDSGGLYDAKFPKTHNAKVTGWPGAELKRSEEL